MSQTSYENVFVYAHKMSEKSLILTQNVLNERKKLYLPIEGIIEIIQEKKEKINQIEQQCIFIEKYKQLIDQNEDFNIPITVIKWKEVKLKPGVYAINCTKCKRTCQDNCIHVDEEKKNFEEMNYLMLSNNGICNRCDCHLSLHQHMPFKYASYKDTEFQTLESLRRQFGGDSTNMLEKARNEYQQIWDQTSEYITKYKEYVSRLYQNINISLSLQNHPERFSAFLKIDFVS